MLDQYCVGCHNQRVKTADVAFDDADLAQVGEHAELWEKAIRKLRAGMMPPPGARRPEKATSDAFAAWLESRSTRPRPRTPIRAASPCTG